MAEKRKNGVESPVNAHREGKDEPQEKDTRPDTMDRPLDQKKNNATLDQSEDSLGYVRVDTKLTAEAGDQPLEAEELDDFLTIGTDPDAVMDEIKDYTDDKEVLEDFRDRQQMTAGSDELYQKLLQHNARGPELSGGDIDADWESADQNGEEAVGGSVFTPDQDVVDELGEAVGIEYDEDEPLRTYEKLEERDLKRWELNPASELEREEALEDLGELGKDDDELEELRSNDGLRGNVFEDEEEDLEDEDLDLDEFNEYDEDELEDEDDFLAEDELYELDEEDDLFDFDDDDDED